jgi:hypothetical protein
VPVMRTTKFELVINLRTARLLGIPTWLLYRINFVVTDHLAPMLDLGMEH